MENNRSFVFAPTSGAFVSLDKINDPVFSSGAMGAGFGIISDDGNVVSPVNGTVTVTNESKHAYGFVSDDGVEVLVHIGIDTVELKGEGFLSNLKQGDRVNVGQTIASFDKQLLESKGYDTVVITVITNSNDFQDIKLKQKKRFERGDETVNLEKKSNDESEKQSKNQKIQILAQSILENVGGQDNISALTHCATRLRFNLRDKTKVNKEELEKLDILQVVEAGSQFQVVIGPKVEAVYQEIMKNIELSSDVPNAAEGNFLAKIFDVVSGSFTPLIPVFCGSGLIKALTSILLMTGVLTPENSTYLILAAAGNAVFYFLPIILGVTAALKLRVNPYIAATIGAALLEPNFTGLMNAGSDVNFMGIPVIASSYSSSVLPILGAVTILYFVERFLKRIIPEQVHLIFVPFLSLLIMVPLTILVFGPFGIYMGNLITQGITFLLSKSAVLTGAILSMVWMFIVMFGLHWALVPIMIGNIATFGSDPIMGLLMGTVWAAGGSALGVFLKTKDTKLKEIAISGIIPCFLSGVSEPIMYGILLRYKRSLLYYIITAGLTGAVAGMFGVSATQIAGGIFTIPTFQPIWGYLVVIAIAIILPVILHVVFGFEENVSEAVVETEQ